MTNVQKNQETITTWLLLLLPAIFYLYLVNTNSLNIPYWDDYQVILMPMNHIAEAADIKSKLGYLLQTNASHIPLVTRGFAQLQILLGNTINFRWGTIFGNLGLFISAYLLIIYLQKKQNFPLDTLIPIPYLFFSISHWGAMHFMVPAWQFYWGATLFPLLTFIAIIERRYAWASLAFAGAIFASSGSLALYPMVILFCLIKKRWRASLIFGVIGSLFLILFFAYQGLPSANTGRKLPDLWLSARYITDFIGSLIPNTEWNSKSNHVLHSAIGILVIVAGVYGVFKIRGADLLKLIFVYTCVLALMALYLRAGDNPYIPSRYSLFSLMAVMSVFMLFIGDWITRMKLHKDISIKIVILISMMVWVFSINQGKFQLGLMKAVKINSVQQYLQSKDNASLKEITPDTTFSELQLSKARQLGIFSLEYKSTLAP